jgi:hypothetical protein
MSVLYVTNAHVSKKIRVFFEMEIKFPSLCIEIMYTSVFI